MTEWADFLEFITAMRLMGFRATLAYNSHFRRQEILRLVHTAAKFLQQETQAIHHTKLRGHYAPVTAAAHRLSLFQTLSPTESPRLPTVGKTKLIIRILFFFSFKPLQPTYTQRHKHHHGPPSQTLTLKTNHLHTSKFNFTCTLAPVAARELCSIRGHVVHNVFRI